MRKTMRQICVLVIIFAMLLFSVACNAKVKQVDQFGYENEENMTFEQLLELDRQNPITIQIMVAGAVDVAATDSPVLAEIARRTGTTVELVAIDNDRLQMLLASKEYPDVVVLNRDATFYDYLQSGDLVDLAPILQQYAPTVYDMNKKLIELFNDEKGQLLYLTENCDLLREGERHPEDATDPNRAQQELPWHCSLYVQYPLVKEVYNHRITTIDEYKAALEAFMEKYADDENKYAISMDKESAGDILWAGLAAYGYKCMYKGGLYVTKDGENYHYGLKVPEAEEWLVFMNQLYRDGYIYEEAPVQSYDQFIRQMNKLKVFSFVGSFYPVYEANRNLAGNEKTADSMYIPQKLMMSGVDQVYQFNAAYTGSGAFLVMKNSPYSKRIARLLEYLYLDEGSTLHGWGIEGEDYIIDANGNRDLNKAIADKIDATPNYNLQRGIRALYSVINLPTFTTDGQFAFARFANYYNSEEGVDARDTIIQQDPEFNWHEDWKGTFWNDYSEVDIVLMAETEAAIASARCAAVIKDNINRIIMAASEEECRALYKETIKKMDAYGIESWEKEVNRQIKSKATH